MSSYNLPSVTQSPFHDHLSRLFALLWNIPCPFLSLCDVGPEFTNLIKLDVDVDVNTRAILEKQLTALHVIRISSFKLICVHFVDKNEDQDQN